MGLIGILAAMAAFLGPPTARAANPPGPQALTLTGSTGTTLSLAWAPPGAGANGSYHVTLNSGASVAATKARVTVNGLTCGTVYQVAVTAPGSSASAKFTARTDACGSPPACTGVQIAPRADVGAIVAQNPAGTAFCFTRGVYYLRSPIVPKDGDRFTGQAGAVLDGSRKITSFKRSGSVWVASDQVTQNTAAVGECAASGSTLCQRANDVFLDGRPLVRAARLAGLSRGQFYRPSGTKKLYLADNPGGHTVYEASTKHAFAGWGTSAGNVVIEWLTVRRFANQAQRGAIEARQSWTVSHCNVLLNHGAGIEQAGSILESNVLENGQLGLGANGGSGALLQGTQIAYNNHAGFSGSWEAGGAKWVKTQSLQALGNYVHDNDGPGLWTDTDNIDTVYQDNTIQANTGPGILVETSYATDIAGNTVQGNGTSGGRWLDGAGIDLLASPNVNVHDNVVSGNYNGIGITQTDRGSGAYGPHEARNIHVFDNSITMITGASGLAQNVGDTSYFTSRNIVFNDNSYHLGCTNSTPFMWKDPGGTNAYALISRTQWVSAGNDPDGTFQTTC